MPNRGRIKKVYLWSDGQVEVCNEDGEPMKRYSGPFDKVRAAILQDAGAKVEYFTGLSKQFYERITRERFERGELRGEAKGQGG